MEAGEGDAAEAALHEALERHPDDAGLRFRQSRLLQQQQRPEEALVAARRAIALDPQKPYWHEHMVKLLIEAGKDGETEAAVRQAFERHPDDAGSASARAGCCSDGSSRRLFRAGRRR
jgi:predicted Zn-dependent protease